ncbi:MAG: hypothetical protein K8T10_21195 [Candidatus Eremiobacteraeota bacterium]|nr:hypothetical protein [Candidatus Eremiobacteraeota bacterium]
MKSDNAAYMKDLFFTREKKVGERRTVNRYAGEVFLPGQADDLWWTEDLTFTTKDTATGLMKT